MLHILDEPTVDQPMADVARLVGVLQRLVDQGHTVLVAEYHTHLLAACDWLVAGRAEAGRRTGGRAQHRRGDADRGLSAAADAERLISRSLKS